MLRKFKALIYVTLGGMLSWTWFERGNFPVGTAIAFFTVCMVIITLSSFGKTTIEWNNSGIKLSSFPKKPKQIAWSQLTDIKADHLGYHIKSSQTSFRISKPQMPDNLLKKIKASIKENNLS